MGTGLVRTAHREDGAGQEFFVTLWVTDSGTWYVYKALAGHTDFVQWRLNTRDDALAIYRSLIATSGEPSRRTA